MMRVEISQEINGVWNRAVIEEEVSGLDDVVNMCERGLRGVGFCFNGSLDIMIPDQPIPEDFNWDQLMEDEQNQVSEEVSQPMACKEKSKGKGKCKKGKC